MLSKKIAGILLCIPAIFFVAGSGKVLYLSLVVITFHIVYECVVYQSVASWGRVVAREIPVARVVGDGLVHQFEFLVDDFYFRLYVRRLEHLCNFL